MAVYFIQSSATGYIKIGKARDVNNRLRQLQTSNPDKLTLLHSFPDYGHREEKEYHTQFKAFRVSGEWFLPDILPLIKPPTRRVKKIDTVKAETLTRIVVHLPKACVETLTRLAKEDSRPRHKHIALILENYTKIQDRRYAKKRGKN